MRYKDDKRGQWSLDLTKYAEKKGEQIDTIRKKVAIDLYNNIVKKTPVDTGRARGNWQISIGQDNTQTTDRVDDGSLGSNSQFIAEEEQKVESAKGDETIYISNNLPYICMLEYGGYSKESTTGKTVNGFSIQAPQGMVGVTVANKERLIKKAIEESGWSK